MAGIVHELWLVSLPVDLYEPNGGKRRPLVIVIHLRHCYEYDTDQPANPRLAERFHIFKFIDVIKMAKQKDGKIRRGARASYVTSAPLLSAVHTSKYIYIYIYVNKTWPRFASTCAARAFGATSDRDSALRASEDSALGASDSISNSLHLRCEESFKIPQKIWVNCSSSTYLILSLVYPTFKSTAAAEFT